MKELIQKINKVRDEKAHLLAELNKIKEKEKELEQEILEELDEYNLDEVKVDNVRVGRKETILFNIVDWDAFIKWCRRRSVFPLQRRPQTTFLREYYEQKNKLPAGIDTYVKESLSIRRV